MGDIKIDYAELSKVINKTMRGPVDAQAERIAAHVRSQGRIVGHKYALPVKVKSGTTKWGWPVAMVTIPHPAALAVEAKYGVLAKAAASVGLTVKAKR